MSKAVLRRLNGDTTWLLQLPWAGEPGLKTYNLLIDPWLSDSEQIDYHPSFSSQSRTVSSSYPSLSSLAQALAHEALEQAAQERVEHANDQERRKVQQIRRSGRIDGILISHPFTDHAHPQSLLELPNTMEEDGPVHLFCTEQSRKAVSSLFRKAGLEHWRYRVILLPAAREGQQSLGHYQEGLPSGISILRLPATESLFTAWGELHSGIAILWKLEDPAEAFSSVVYSPHGTLQTSLPSFLNRAAHRVLITSFDEQRLPLLQFITGPVALGFEAAVLSCYPSRQESSTTLNESIHYAPTMIVRTHDEKKLARGLVGQFLRRKEMGMEAAQEMLRLRVGQAIADVQDTEVGRSIEVG